MASSCDDGEFPTDWDVDTYHTDHETEEHWALRKRFMETHKTKFPENRLVCLAQVFTNMEFMGCKYPTETMRVVAELAKDVAKDYRTQRAGKLKRTFVSAKDAAESRAKGRKNTELQMEGPSTSGYQPAAKKQRMQDDLFDGLSFGKFILYIKCGRLAVRLSAQWSKMEFEEKEVPGPGQKKRFEIHLNNKLLASAVADSIKAAKTEAYDKALDILQKNCYSIKPKPLRDTIKIEKTDNKVTCDVTKQCSNAADEKRLDDSNKGYKMMKMMGWTGGGLGSTTQGRIDPVGYLFKSSRAGLGNTNKLDRQYFTQMLQNYVDSEDIRELQFENSFTKDERAMLHEIAGSLNLKSVSQGKGDNRRLNITKRSVTSEQILNEILLHGNTNYTDLYLVQVPESKFRQFPEYTAKLELDL